MWRLREENSARRPAGERAFTLLELLVVVSVLAILAAMLLPSLSSAKERGRKAVCVSNLRQTGLATHLYAGDFGGRIPFGPKAPPFTSPADFYPSTGAPTSLISLRSGALVGLGLLLPDYLARQSRVLFCPGADQVWDADAELAKAGTSQAQASYYYRHGGNTRLFDPPGGLEAFEQPQLDRLGKNRLEQPIRVLAMDTLFLCPPDLATYQVKPRTHHRSKFANLLFADGHVSSRANTDRRFEVDLTDYSQLRNAFDKILAAFERADTEP